MTIENIGGLAVRGDGEARGRVPLKNLILLVLPHLESPVHPKNKESPAVYD